MSSECSKTLSITMTQFPRCFCGDADPSPLRPAIKNFDPSLFDPCFCTPTANPPWDGIIRFGNFSPFDGCGYFQNQVPINGCLYDVVLLAGGGGNCANDWVLYFVQSPATLNFLWFGRKTGGAVCVSPIGVYTRDTNWCFGPVVLCSVGPATLEITAATP